MTSLTSFHDGRIVARRFGDAADILALHGWGRDSSDWAPSLEGFNALAPDLPGFGLSPAPTVPWTTKDYASNVLELLGQSHTRPLLIGHSFGGRVALQAAVLAPERFRGLVLSGVPLLREPGASSSPAWSYRLARAARRRGVLSEARFARIQGRHGSADYRNAVGVMRTVLVLAVNEDYREQLQALRTPPAFLWGELDASAPLPMAERAAQLAGATLTVLPGVGHLLPTEAPSSIRAMLSNLLAQ